MNNKGFTLMEMLIVVAIIAVLVAIAIPVFGAQLEKAREAVDAANLRAAYAEVSADALLGDGSETKNVVQKQTQDGWTVTFDWPTGFNPPGPTDSPGYWTVGWDTDAVTVVWTAGTP